MDPIKKANLERNGWVVCDTPEELFKEIFGEVVDIPEDIAKIINDHIWDLS